jgi:hypothetical protein
MRVPLKGRIEDVWINYKSGEWKGMFKGQNIKSFEFEENIIEEGKKKNDLRKMLQMKLRAACDEGVVDADVPLIDALIRRSRIARGSVLQLEILQAESFLKYRKQVIKAVRKMQALARGNTGRKRYKALRRAARDVKARYQEMIKQSIALSRSIAPQLIQAGAENATKDLSSVSFRLSLNLSGVFTVVTVTAAARQAKRSPDLCAVCTVQGIPVSSHPANKDYGIAVTASKRQRRQSMAAISATQSSRRRSSVMVSARAPTTFLANGGIAYVNAGAGLHKERDMCTCRWMHSEEKWTVEIFDPLSGARNVSTLGMSEIQRRIEDLVRVRKTMFDDKEYIKNALIGRSFGNLAPLFEDSGIAFDGRLDMSYSYARLNAAKVNALLPLIPAVGDGDYLGNTHATMGTVNTPGGPRRGAKGRKVTKFTPEVLNAIRQRTNLPVDLLTPTQMNQSSSGVQVRSNIENVEHSQPMGWVFEPLQDVLYAKRHIQRVIHHQGTLRTLIAQAEDELNRRIDEVAHFMQTKAESIPMQYEDKRSMFIRTDEQLEAAQNKIITVMAKQKQATEDYAAQEQNQQEDWAQDYDGLDNGSAWRGLNDSRKLQERWALSKREYHHYCAMCPDLLPLQKRLEKGVREAMAELARCEANSRQYAPVLAQVEAVAARVYHLSRTSVAAGLAFLAFPRKMRSPVKRRIQRSIPYHLAFVRDPLIRAQPQNIAAWNLLDRRPMALRPVNNVSGSRSVLRCVVEVFKDPVTGYVLIRLVQDEAPTEESTMHLDMGLQKEELTDLTASALETDILLRPRDVATILSKPPNWPAVHIHKETLYFSHNSKFLGVQKEKVEKARAQARVDTELAAVAEAEAEAAAAAMKKNKNGGNSSVKSVRSGSSRGGSSRGSMGSASGSASVREAKASLLEAIAAPVPVGRAPPSPSRASSSSSSSRRRGGPSSGSRSPPRGGASRRGGAYTADSSQLSMDTGLVDLDGAGSSLAESNEAGISNQGTDALSTQLTIAEQQELEQGQGQIQEAGVVNKSFTPRLPRFEEEGWVPPSKRVRSLEGVKRFPTKSARFDGMEKTFQKRIEKKEDDERLTAVKLMAYLRLQPYTGRPCLGLVHMARRMLYAGTIAAKSLWYRDVARGRPSAWVNEVGCGVRYVCNRLALVKVRASLNHLEVLMDAGAGAPWKYGSGHQASQQLSLMIPLLDIVRNLTNAPLLLGAFLTETVTNTYSRTTLDRIIDNIDFQLAGYGQGLSGAHANAFMKAGSGDPNGFSTNKKKAGVVDETIEDPQGDERGKRRFWRGAFFGEVPRLRYLVRDGERFRGPVFRCFRFIAGRYFEVAFLLSSTDDLKVVLKSPKDGQFACHRYLGSPIVINLTRDENRAFVARLATADTCPDAYKGTLNFLHPNYFIDYFPLLLDMVIVDIEAAGVMSATKDSIRKEKKQSRPRDAASAVDASATDASHFGPKYEVVNGSALHKAGQELAYITQKFNAWYSKRAAEPSPLAIPQLHARLLRSLQTYYEPQPWHLSLVKDSTKGSLVEVKRGVWNSLDLARFTGEVYQFLPFAQRDRLLDYRVHTQGMKAADLRAYASTRAVTLHHHMHSSFSQHLQHGNSDNDATIVPYTGTIGIGHCSLWDLRVLADETRKSFYLDLKRTDISDVMVQALHEKHELQLMEVEDCDAHYYRHHIAHTTTLWDTVDNSLGERAKYVARAMPKILAIRKRHSAHVQEAEDAIAKLFGVLDAWLVSRACLATDEIKVSLDLVKMGKTKKKKKMEKQRDSGEGAGPEPLDLLRLSGSKFCKQLTAAEPERRRYLDTLEKKNEINISSQRVKRKALHTKCVPMIMDKQVKPAALISLLDFTQGLVTSIQVGQSGDEEADSDVDGDDEKGKKKKKNENNNETKEEAKVRRDLEKKEKKEAKRQASIDERAEYISNGPSVVVLMANSLRNGVKKNMDGVGSVVRAALTPHHQPAMLSLPSSGTMPRYDQYPSVNVPKGVVHSTPSAINHVGSEKLMDTYRNPGVWRRPTQAITATISTSTAVQESVAMRHKRTAALTGLARAVPVMPRTMRLGDRIVMASPPVVGPGDCVAIALYDPMDSVGWQVSVCAAAPDVWPFVDIAAARAGAMARPASSGLPVFASLPQGRGVAGVSFATSGATGVDGGKKDKAALVAEAAANAEPARLVRHVAAVTVWRSLCHGVGRVLVQKTVERLEQENKKEIEKVVRAQAKLQYKQRQCLRAHSEGVSYERFQEKGKKERGLIEDATSLRTKQPSSAEEEEEAPHAKYVSYNFPLPPTSQAPPAPDTLTAGSTAADVAAASASADDLRGDALLTGIFIPADEVHDCVPFTARSTKWHAALQHFLNPQAQRMVPADADEIKFDSNGRKIIPPAKRFEVMRSVTLSAFVFTVTATVPAVSSTSASDGKESNGRLCAWVDEYVSNKGWRTDAAGLRHLQHLLALEQSLHGASAPGTAGVPLLTGDSVLLLRNNRDLPVLTTWLQGKVDEYAPIKALRIEKEGRETEFRIENHVKFRNAVFAMARVFLDGMHKLFRHEASINNDEEDVKRHLEIATAHSVRVLITRFMELRAMHEKDSTRDLPTEAKIRHARVLDEAWLLDTAVAHMSHEQLERFDGLPDPTGEVMTGRMGVLEWEVRGVDDLGNDLNEGRSRPDLQPRPGQLMYAMYLMHCSECTKPTGTCRIPGCGAIRCETVGIVDAALRKATKAAASGGSGSGSGSVVVAGTDSTSTSTSTNDLSNAAVEYEPVTVDKDLYSHLTHLVGTGAHPLELVVKTYLMSTYEFHKALLPVHYTKGDGMLPAAEELEEARLDAKAEDDIVQREYLAMRYKDLLAEGQHLRYVHRRMLGGEKRRSILAEEVLEAKGGMARIIEETSLNYGAGAGVNAPAYRAANQSTALVTTTTTNEWGAEEDSKLSNMNHVLALRSSHPVTDSVAIKAAAAAAAAYSQARVPVPTDLQRVLTEEEAFLAQQTGSTVNEAVGEGSIVEAAASTASTAQSLTGGLLEIPRDIVMGLLGHCGVDGRNREVPIWAIDPYPAIQGTKKVTSAKERYAQKMAAAKRKAQRRKRRENAKIERKKRLLRAGITYDEEDDDEDEGEEDDDEEEEDGNGGGDETGLTTRQPMAQVMFEWLCQHLQVTRPSALPSPASGDRGQHDDTAVVIKLDRLHCEGVLSVEDGSLVVVQVLQGVLDDAPLVQDSLSGTPPGAVRFLPTGRISHLQVGLCIIVYDIRSGVTRVLPLEGRGLSRCADAFGIDANNTPLIARKILEHGSQIILLSRVGNDCTGFGVDVNRLPPEALHGIPSLQDTDGGDDNINSSSHMQPENGLLADAAAAGAVPPRTYTLDDDASTATTDTTAVPRRELRLNPSALVKSATYGRRQAKVDARAYRLEVAKARYKDRVLNAL